MGGPRNDAEQEVAERSQRRASSCGRQIEYGNGRGERRCHERKYGKCKLGYCRACHDETQEDYPQYSHQC